MKYMINLLFSLLFIYALICAALYFLQDKLIFFPPVPVAEVYRSASKNEINFSIQQQNVHGWKIVNAPNNAKTLLYFGGNAEDVVYFNFEAAAFNVGQSITFNYPGYGKSSGRPSQQNLYNRSLEIYDHVMKTYQLQPQNIVLVGRSLGSSMATYVAAHRENAGLVLITPFDSIKNIAAKQYKYLPVTLLIKHPFPTVEYITKVQSPVLMLAAVNDEIISNENLQNLKQAAGKKTQLIIYPNVGHNTLQTNPQYYPDINRFIQSL